MNDTCKSDAQEIKKQKRRDASKRANERARSVDGLFGLELFIRNEYNPQVGIGTRKPNSDRSWCYLPKCFFSAAGLLRHVQQKESLALTWGSRATIRVIDADAHGCADRLEALPTLWEAVQALHLGREMVVQGLVNGRIPDGVRLDGVIVTSPNGLHYVERTVKPTGSDCLTDDTARILGCLTRYGVTVRPGHIEVLPSTNGQSRLPLGYGCEFVYPNVGVADFQTGSAILDSMERVRRDFPDVASLTSWVPTVYEVGGVGESFLLEPEHAQSVVSSVDQEPERIPIDFSNDEERSAYFAHLDQPAYTVPKVNQKYEDAKLASRKLRTFKPSLVCESSSRSSSEDFAGSEFVERAKSILINGASIGNRNREAWELCMYFRLTRGFSREETERQMIQWIETAPHLSKDLRSGKKSTALRNLRTHLDKFDTGLASGVYYQCGDGVGERRSSSKLGDALLLCPMGNEEDFRSTGLNFLQDANGDSLLTNMPEWIRSTLPTLVGAVVHCSRNGMIALPVDTVKEYSRTRKSKQDPFDGKKRPAYQILIALLERFGVVSGIVRKARKAARLAAVYETNIGRHALQSRESEASVRDKKVSGANTQGDRVLRASAEVEGDRTRATSSDDARSEGEPDLGFAEEFYDACSVSTEEHERAVDNFDGADLECGDAQSPGSSVQTRAA